MKANIKPILTNPRTNREGNQIPRFMANLLNRSEVCSATSWTSLILHVKGNGHAIE
jgi:hypothetical protein